jgi:hypothetical protein
VSAIAGGKVKIPGGVGALLDCRRASHKARTATAAPAGRVTSTPGAVPAPGPRDPDLLGLRRVVVLVVVIVVRAGDRTRFARR